MSKPEVKFSISEAKFSGYLLDSIINLMVFDSDFLKRSFSLFKPDVFDGERRTVAELCYDYFQKYGSCPGEYIVDVAESFLSRKPTQRSLLLRYLERVSDVDANKDYVLTEFGGYVGEKICTDSIVRAEALTRRGRKQEAREDIIRSFKDAELLGGGNVFNFLDPANIDSIFEQQQGGSRTRRTLIDPYDRKTGGLQHPEMVLIFGEKNVGKSFLMVHLGTVLALQGEAVAEVHLETPLAEIKARHAAGFTGMKSKFRHDEDEGGGAREAVKARLRKKIDFVRRKGGSLWLHKDTSFTIDKLVAYLDNLEFVEGKRVTTLLLDSPKQMIVDKYRDYLRDQEWLYRRLHDLSQERDLILVVTGWAQRKSGGYESSSMTRGQQIGGSIEQVNIVDTVWTFSQNEMEAMKGLLWMFVPYARTHQRAMTIEIKQDLDRGQFVVSSREVPAGSRAAEEARKLGVKYDNEHRKNKEEGK